MAHFINVAKHMGNIRAMQAHMDALHDTPNVILEVMLVSGQVIQENLATMQTYLDDPVTAARAEEVALPINATRPVKRRTNNLQQAAQIPRLERE